MSDVVAIIQARMGSTRLQGKVMLDIMGKPVLWHVVNRVSKARLINKLIVATTVNSEDDIIMKFCNNNDTSVFRGAEEDVLDRYYNCAKKYELKNIVRITADCPLHDPNIIDTVINEYLKGNYDYVSNTLEYTFPDGFDVEVFSFNALADAWKNAKLPSEREHVTPYIKNNKKFRKKNVFSNEEYPVYRCSLDHIEDYEFTKKIYEGIGREMFYIDDVMNYVRRHPEISKINQHIRINEGYLKSLAKDENFPKQQGVKNE